MGCFSFMCKECGKPVLSNSFTGQEVTLSLLKEGTVIQSMTGQYDSYGRVFIEGTKVETNMHGLKESVQWANPTPEVPLDEGLQKYVDEGDDHWVWSRVCDLMFSKDTSNGIAAVHTKCQVEGKVPVTRSEDDPDQGWGDDLELLGDIDPDTDLG